MLGVKRPSTVPVAEKDGGVRHLSLNEWRVHYLPEAMQRSWTDPDALARLVECAVDVGMHADVLASAKHLSRIDPDRDRRYGLAAVVFARNGQFSKAEEIIDRYESLYGETWFGLFARADVALSGNRWARGRDLLRRALAIDPDASRPLRRLINTAGRDDPAQVFEEVRRIASVRGGWRAKLWLAANEAAVKEPEEILRLARDAVEQSRDERQVLAIASSVFAGRRLTRGLVDFIAPRYQIGRDRLACGVNLLFGFLAAGRKVHGEALLQRIGPMLHEASLGGYADFYETGFRNLRDAGGGLPAQGTDVDLLKVMAASVRLNSKRARRKCWDALDRTHLLVPVRQAWIEVPVLESPWPDTPELIELVTGIDSEGREVVIAFTDERTLRAWGPMQSPCVAMGTRALLEIIDETKDCSLLVNPAGPTAVELAMPDIEAFLSGAEPPAVESRIRFLAGGVRRRVPADFLPELGRFLRESRIAREAWLFEIVDDRSGVNPAVAIDFDVDAPAPDVRDVLLDAADEVRWDARRSRRVRFIPIGEGRFAGYIRSVGIGVPLR